MYDQEHFTTATTEIVDWQIEHHLIRTEATSNSFPIRWN